MAILRNIVVRIRGNTADLNNSLTKTQGIVGRFGAGARKTFGAVGKAAVALGAITIGALGLFATSIASGVKGLVEFEQELRPAIERSRIGAEALQLLAEAAKRAGSEDGLEAVVDSSQELQLQLGELALTGNARAVPALESLGLSAAKLQAMEPEAAFRAVLEALQQIPNVADRAIAAEEIFGGTSEKLAGLINLTNAEFAALNAEVAKTTDIWSGETLEAAKEFDQELQNLKTDLQRGTNAIVAGLLPSLIQVVQFIRSTGLPAFQELKAQALEPLERVLRSRVIPVLGEMFDVFATQIWPLLRDFVIPIWVDFVQKRLVLIKAVYDNVVGPVLNTLTSVLSEALPKAIALVSGLFGGSTKQMGTDAIRLNADMTGSFQPIVDLFNNELLPLFREISDFVWPLVQEAWEDSLKPTFLELQNLIQNTIIPLIIENKEIFIFAWTAIKFTLLAVLKVLIVALEGFIGIATAIIRTFSSVLRGDWAAAWQAVQDIGEEAFELILGIFSAFGIDLQSVWRNALEGVRSVFASVFDPIARSIQNALNSISRVRNAASSAANAIANLANIRIPGFAGGVENFRGGSAIVGERGPELVTLPRGASVTPNGQAGGSTFNISVSANTRSDGRAIAREVRREIRQLKLEGVLT